MSALKFLLEHLPELLAALGALSVAGGVVARLTPNKTDDSVVAKLQDLLERASTLFAQPKAK